MDARLRLWRAPEPEFGLAGPQAANDLARKIFPGISRVGRPPMKSALEFSLLRPGLASGLASLFAELVADGDNRWFHPHPFTDEESHRLCAYTGRDLYYAAHDGSYISGYGMLRGWDAGFAVPSLGIIIRRQARGLGLGRAFMSFLHAAARNRGAGRIRLTVYRENLAAVALYRGLGYQFEDVRGDQQVGYFDLSNRRENELC